MKDLIRISSATLTIIAGVTILTLWILAGNDKGRDDQGMYKCRGCLYLFHDYLAQDRFITDGTYDLSLNSWLKNYRDPSTILMGFGVIIGVLWIIIGIMGYLAYKPIMAIVYLLSGVATYIIFVVLFAVIVERIEFIKKGYCADLWAKSCRTDDDWKIRHYYDSTEEFWGAALFCFMMGAYQIASAVFLCVAHTEARPPKQA